MTEPDYQTPPAIAALTERLRLFQINFKSDSPIARLLEAAQKPKRRRAAPRTSLSSVAKQATKARIPVRQYDVDPNTGKISVIVGPVELAPDQQSAEAVNEWDTPL